MGQNQLLITALLAILLFHSEIIVSTADPVFRLIHDLIQHNIAGVPVTHQKTEWDFDPEVGKQRRVRYEQENGRFGETAIAKIGMGIGYKGPWGKLVDN
ncbi:uncharacterized protein LOC105181362 isoform X1 [Harpegnathos saltator]|uniref:Uncharacterized protein n=1 Tax=Harpegnathos saltator TaxID=610380 RepID=E2BCM7_HARSA|nr:uncharacterized protein LOC105181362 isoform X1 [Harpegnathos saltator]XP_025158662.1 uncharacterized protein LOC105181362 isoform X1 [Harpegnathos saltator]EFN86537.1 hypothetical protein EAI_04375 [Harpegnathos saltator]